MREHYPDIYVAREQDRELWEVKSESEALQTEFCKRTSVLKQGLAAYSLTYRVVLDSELRKESRLQNAKTILRFGRHSPTDDECEYVEKTLKQDHKIGWADACNGRFGRHGREIVCHLVLQGVLSFEMSSSLSATSQFFKREE